MAKIDVLKIVGYDEMTAEEKLAALESFEYDDGNSTIEKLKGSVSKACSEAAEWKKKHNALLSEEEKKKAEREEEYNSMATKLKELEQAKKVSEYVSQYVAMGYDGELAKATAEAKANGDDATVFANQVAFNNSLEQKIKAELIKGTPTPPAGKPTTGVTKKDFLGMSYEEQVKFKEENPDWDKKLK